MSLGLVVALARATARAECQHVIAVASSQAAALRDTAGKAALLEQIQRADIARHEGDDAECREQLAMATDVLDRIDAARH